ncbi:M23 family metallopeptidase [Desulfobaculum bizertense]|uniref:Murein DD-endopeptidase MepM and murein hydrolase activator NlpD, contain LysM domain n=1 Tax=Desulfobaculum bizertense DSM 18034 TaxID=1121442 RepID=A0A1T4W140_9BACT|nr:M23 family metallopeptidase [Desulfobaculum bizertense]SKA70960.1 Murein DD-endopeptidase MepM and murein hydrolase activator NlpD, contain LysM domain [Desulfobaculum bizertense DSM 18034]
MKKFLIYTLILIVLAAAAFGFVAYFKDTDAPKLALTPDKGYIGTEAPFVLEVQDPITGIKEISVVASQGDKSISLLSVTSFADPLHSSLEFDLSKSGFKNGSLTISVTATDRSIYNMGKGNTSIKQWKFDLDTEKPRILVLSRQHNIARGGTTAITYTVNEPVSKSGIQVKGHFFPGYQQPSGAYLCFFAYPQDLTEEEFQPALIATDKAGNSSRGSFYYHTINKKFRHDVINLPDRFLNAKMPQFEDDFPDAKTQLERYLLVNRELRVKNRARMRVLGQQTLHTPQWAGRFLRLPNAANRARFGDRRIYRYHDKDVDHQTHLGIDLASIRNAKVPAANSGKIVFTGFFGIYGDTVIIDHGCGLMTLYAHLSQIGVNTGDTVNRGDIIARTGATGLAGGDHLHFGVFVGGIPVDPIEWWDARWIKNNIQTKLDLAKSGKAAD